MGKLINTNQKLIFIDSDFKKWIIEIIDPVRFNQKNIVSNLTNITDKMNRSMTEDKFESIIKSKFTKLITKILTKNNVESNDDIINDFIYSPIFEYYSRVFTPVVIRCKVINKCIKLYLSYKYYIKSGEYIGFKSDTNKSDYFELVVNDSLIDELINDFIILKYNELIKVSIEFNKPLSIESEFELDKLFNSLSGMQSSQSNFKSINGFIYSYELNPYHMKLKSSQVIKNTGYWLYTKYDNSIELKDFLIESLGELFNEDLYNLSNLSNEINEIHVIQYQFSELLNNLNEYITKLVKYGFGDCNIVFDVITEKFME